MRFKQIKWLIYTVSVGLIPMLARFFVWLVSTSTSISLFNPSDFVAFGLILHISNINEIEHLSDSGKKWKTIQIGLSIIFIAIYGVLFALTIIAGTTPENIKIETIKYSVMILCAVSFLLSYSVFHEISHLATEDD